MSNSATPEESSRSDNSSGGVQSVDRAISVLQILARRGAAGVTEIAQEIDVHKSTAFRLLSALEERELVEQPHQRGKYELGLGLVRLAAAVPRRLDLVQQGRPVCERLAGEFGETVNIAVLRSHYVVNLDQAWGPATVGAHNWIGQLTPLHATSSGKVLLAYLDRAERKALLDASGMQRYTAHTIVSRRTLSAQLDAAFVAGYATTAEEYEPGLNAIAAPIRDHNGAVVAAVSLSGPAYRLDLERLDYVSSGLIKGAEEIGARIGHLG